MGDDRKAEYEMAPTSDPENPEMHEEKAELGLETEEENDQQWSGLGKEELLRVADTPAWNWTRNILLIIFWLAWILMLIVAIVLVVKAPSCPHVEWYEKSSMYQVYMRSFKDSDGDGYGDLKGLINQVEKIKANSGAETIVVSSLLKQAEGSSSLGEVVDFKDVDPTFGTQDDFVKLIEKIQINAMHVVLEFDPNHSSDKHKWFIESSKAEDNDYKDFYIWMDGANGGGPPNDWKNYKNDAAWSMPEGNDTRKQYYYHFYEPTQPDLNFRNANVTANIKDAMNFWLAEMKVDGFLLVNADRLLEPPVQTSVGRKRRQVTDIMLSEMSTISSLTDMMDVSSPEPTLEPTRTPEPETSDGSQSSFVQYDTLGEDNEFSTDTMAMLDDLYSVLKVNSYLGKYRVFIPQHSGSVAQNKLYQKNGWRGFPNSLQFPDSIGNLLNSYTITGQIQGLIDAETEETTNPWNGWTLGHAGISRIATRAGDNARALMMLLYTLPGTPMPFYGDELGLTDGEGENGQLVPYPWDDSMNGGFSDNKTLTNAWMPYANDLAKVNAKTQANTDGSFLKYVKSLSDFHSEPSLVSGKFNITTVSGVTLAYTRSFEEWPTYVVVINFGSTTVPDFPALDTEQSGVIRLSASGNKIEESVKLDKVMIGSNDAYLIELVM